MKRRSFLKKLPALGSLPYTLNGIPFGVMSATAPLTKLAGTSDNDRVLILLQLHGGNDGLNMVIPIADYDRYFNIRPNLAIPDRGARGFIPLDSTLPTADQIGLHPDMIGLKEMYDQGNLKIVQGVSYERNNGSHFRGRDIMFMGGGPDDYLSSGWIGRYFNQYIESEFGGNPALDLDGDGQVTYPEDFPNPEMLDPLALEFGNEVSLIFHQDGNIPTSISFATPERFERLVNELEGFNEETTQDPRRGFPPAFLENSPYGKELNWILGLEDKTGDYAERLAELYNQGLAQDQGVQYPEQYPFPAPQGRLRTNLDQQLKIVANLMSGGSKTKVYLLRLGGFDTHADQVEADDPTFGVHAALLYHISSNMKAFFEDLRARGISDRVLAVTTSEFGRRIPSNGAFGSDHGRGAPMLVFGEGVLPGVLGTNPDLTRNNVGMQYDYRQVYSAILKDWFCVDASLVDQEFNIFWGDYQGRGSTIPLLTNSVTATQEFIDERFYLNNCYPNPASGSTTISFFMNRAQAVELFITDNQGRVVQKVLNNKSLGIGEHTYTVNLQGFPTGVYRYHIKAGLLQDSKQFVVYR